jgi:hypothetical protein
MTYFPSAKHHRGLTSLLGELVEAPLLVQEPITPSVNKHTEQVP